MRSSISTVYALVDWHNIQSTIAPTFHLNPRRHLPDALLKLQQQIAQVLAQKGARHRVTLRVYHGWHEARTPTQIRRDFEWFAASANLARRISNVAFSPRIQFGNELACHDGSTPLYSTYRGGGQGAGQKMVDTAIVCDFLHLLSLREADCCIIVSDDDDYIPALLTAKSWSRDAILIRQAGNDVRHATDVDCHLELAYWSTK